MLPIWIEDAEDRSKCLMNEGLKKILADTKDSASIIFVEGNEDEYSDKKNEDVGSVEVTWYITVSHIILHL